MAISLRNQVIPFVQQAYVKFIHAVVACFRHFAVVVMKKSLLKEHTLLPTKPHQEQKEGETLQKNVSYKKKNITWLQNGCLIIMLLLPIFGVCFRARKERKSNVSSNIHRSSHICVHRTNIHTHSVSRASLCTLSHVHFHFKVRELLKYSSL